MMKIIQRSARSNPKTLVVRQAPRERTRALLQFGPLVFPVAIGRNGRTIIKREGDGKTPISRMRILSGFFRHDRKVSFRSPLKIEQISADMHWCDEPVDPNYNRLTRFPRKTSHEDMKRSDGLYDVCLVLDWNVTSRKRNCGSAIFMHMIRPGYQPTAGCIALHPRDMKRLLPYLTSKTVVRVL